MRHTIKKHKKKIAYTMPFIFFLFFGMNIFVVPEFLPRESISLISIGNENIVTVGDVFFADVMAVSDTPINAIEASLSFPSDLLEVENISLDGSILDLWPKKPSFSNASGTILWSGGTVQPGGFVQTGKIFNIAFVAKKTGEAKIRFDKALFAAYDGKGTILFPVQNGISYTIRPKTKPSPDFNNDGSITFTDINLWVVGYFRSYDPRYDLNTDGKVNLGDLSIFLSR
jgi:hypothetical protein